MTGSGTAAVPAGQQPLRTCIQSFSLQDVGLDPVSFAPVFVVHSPSSHLRVW